MKLTSVALLTSLAMILSACGEDRSHPSDPAAANYQPEIVLKSPTAVIDLNASTHTYVENLDAYTVGGGARTTVEDPFTFSAASSHDNDEDNQSIVSYSWNVTHTFSANCVDINTTAGQTIFHFANTDTNTTCFQEAVDNGEINATVTVKDDEGATDTETMLIKTN